MTKKQLFIHIGPPKTGSSSIQKLLAQSYDILLEQGVLYPHSGRPVQGKNYRVHTPIRDQQPRQSLREVPMESHHLLAWALMNEVENFDFYRCWSLFLSELNQVNPHTIVISSEAFARLPEDKIIQFQSLLSDFQTKIIFYIRDPFLRTLSKYTQMVKAESYFRSFHYFIRDDKTLDSLFNNEVILERYKKYFGPENLFIKDFDGIVQDSSLEKDFLETLGLNSNDYKISPIKKNASPSPEVIRACRVINLIEYKLRKASILEYPFKLLRNWIQGGGRGWQLFWGYNLNREKIHPENG